eukprot:TRINITY_DN4005_c0_g1_i1.p1 TRINITY_DN4005_c0_g1~~TRINITY_DN4005_c0_g1_i1.p1  ORF type:complete len:351 (+),score=67.72 TRINITY_DN4005_c0_g1_i1:204-1256(+)
MRRGGAEGPAPRLTTMRPQQARLIATARRQTGTTVEEQRQDLLDCLEEQQQAGQNFRCLFYFLIFLVVALLFYLRVDRDTMTPQVEIKERPVSEADPLREAAAELERQFAEQRRAAAVARGEDPDAVAAEKVDLDEMDHHELEQLVQKRQSDLARCEGMSPEDCRKQSKALTMHFDQVSAHVEKDFYKVLHVDPAAADPQTIRRAYDEAKSNPDIGRKDLALIKEARDLLLNPETRLYYNLYGNRPPTSMKGSSARHGGWGTEWMLGTYRFKLVEAWLRYFEHRWWATMMALMFIFAPPLFHMLPKFYAMINWAKHLEKRMTGEYSDSEDELADNRGHRRGGGGMRRRVR